jgi:hypothetical protein
MSMGISVSRESDKLENVKTYNARGILSNNVSLTKVCANAQNSNQCYLVLPDISCVINSYHCQSYPESKNCFSTSRAVLFFLFQIQHEN